jgi:hypothetical protein
MENSIETLLKFRKTRNDMFYSIAMGFYSYKLPETIAIDFRDIIPRTDVSMMYHQGSGLAVGDSVMIHSNLESLLISDTKPNQTRFGGKILAFVSYAGKSAKLDIDITFCVLVGGTDSEGKLPCNMSELDKKRKEVPLYFTGCLEKIKEK